MTEHKSDTKTSEAQIPVQRREIEPGGEMELVERMRQAAHDIRSPLSALNFLVKDMKRFDPEKQKLFIEVVRRINDIAEDLLGSSRDGSLGSHKNIEKKENDGGDQLEGSHRLDASQLGGLLHDLLEMKKLEFAQVKFTLDLGNADSDGFVAIHSKELQRVVSNLINNSIEANADSVELSVDHENDELLLVLVDNGVGISQVFLDRLQEGRYGVDDCRGFGMGLRHAQKVVRNTKGRLMIHSRAAKDGYSQTGTKVTLVLKMFSC